MRLNATNANCPLPHMYFVQLSALLQPCSAHCNSVCFFLVFFLFLLRHFSKSQFEEKAHDCVGRVLNCLVAASISLRSPKCFGQLVSSLLPPSSLLPRLCCL